LRVKNPIQVNNGFAVIDYAHTPDAEEKVINAYNELKKNRVITIIGCGGDRDPKKRPIMGKIATHLSDYVIFTNDNPRTEKPENIMKDILSGVTKNNYEVILDRKAAIKKGLTALKSDAEVLRVARIKAQEMVDKNYFSHTSPTYGSPFEMLKNFKISYKSAGENIAGNSSNSGAVNAWMNSSGHRANILNSSFNYTGIGVVKSPTYGKVYVQMFIGK